MPYKSVLGATEAGIRKSIFEGYTQTPTENAEESDVNEGLRQILVQRFDPSFSVMDHHRCVTSTIAACRKLYGQKPRSFLEPKGDDRKTFNVQLHLPMTDTTLEAPPDEDLAMTRYFESMQVKDDRGNSVPRFYSNIDHYHELESKRTVKVATGFDPDSAFFKTFEYEGAEKDFLHVNVEELDGEKVLKVTYADRTGTIAASVPPTLLEPIQTWANEKLIPIGSTDSVD